LRNEAVRNVAKLWPFAALLRRRRVTRISRLRELAQATRALYASSEPFAPYRTVNVMQRAVTRQLSWALAPLVPPALRIAAGKRAAQAVLASAQSQLVREAIKGWHAPRHRAVLPLPPSTWQAWRGALVDRPRSVLSFALMLMTFWIAGLRRYIALARHMRAVPALSQAPYAVAVGVSANVVGCAARGGFLKWLHDGPAREFGASDIVAVVGGETSGDRPAWLHVAREVLPPLGGPSFGFLLRGVLLLVLMPVLALCGVWQAVVLLGDLIELDYARRVRSEKFARAYLFLLGDQVRRPLWTFHVAARGVRTPLVFYASSYQLFGYGVKVPPDLRHPSLLLNIWDECWFQSEPARADIAALLPPHMGTSVVGAFDMVDSGAEMPRLPPRTVAVFDVEPTASLLRLSQAGYIIPTLTEQVVLDFWQKLAEAARSLDFVIVHKPKRYGLLQQEWRYRRLLRSLEDKGRCISLPPEFGTMRVMAQVSASAILPFTSVGDLADGTRTAFYFDAYGTIPQPEKYAGGLPVAAGSEALNATLRASFEGTLQTASAG